MAFGVADGAARHSHDMKSTFFSVSEIVGASGIRSKCWPDETARMRNSPLWILGMAEVDASTRMSTRPLITSMTPA
ncbi:MAG: hypothetical protein JWR80_3699, partial [Bradyrhizobium sp.]|nr:hypothetical protein [Bradyrhizobium sp.]